MGKKYLNEKPLTDDQDMLCLDIKAGPYVYEIIENDDIYKIASENREDYLGLTLHGKGQVLIAPDMPSGIKKETIFHEIMHVAKQMSGLMFGLKNEDIESDLEEKFVSAISPALYTILLENPQLRVLLFDDSGE